jgi:hypothetical protein
VVTVETRVRVSEVGDAVGVAEESGVGALWEVKDLVSEERPLEEAKKEVEESVESVVDKA